MEQVLTETRKCGRHGIAKFKLRRAGKGLARWRCTKCEYAGVKRRRRKLKEKLVAYFGGECIQCGYDKCLRALGFHHRDPATKKFSMNMGHRVKWDDLLEEAKKCDLLCFNCHMEVEEELARS